MALSFSSFSSLGYPTRVCILSSRRNFIYARFSVCTSTSSHAFHAAHFAVLIRVWWASLMYAQSLDHAQYRSWTQPSSSGASREGGNLTILALTWRVLMYADILGTGKSTMVVLLYPTSLTTLISSWTLRRNSKGCRHHLNRFMAFSELRSSFSVCAQFLETKTWTWTFFTEGEALRA
jgi:hypothetical protein